MKYLNPFSAIIIIILLFVFLALNYFELPRFVQGKTIETQGKIIDVENSKGLKGWGWVQKIKYLFKVDDSIYVFNKTIDKRQGRQNIGNTFKIKCAKSNPKNHKTFIKNIGMGDYFIENYYGKSNSSRHEIKIINSLFFIKEFDKRGKIINECIAEYEILHDTIIAEPYIFSINQKYKTKIRFLRFSKEGYRQLIDLQTNIVYY